MKNKNYIDLWLKKVTQITERILDGVYQGTIPEQADLDNRERLIKLLKDLPSNELNHKQISDINAILAQDKEIIIRLEEISLLIKKEIRQTFLNRKAISKFNSKEL